MIVDTGSIMHALGQRPEGWGSIYTHTDKHTHCKAHAKKGRRAVASVHLTDEKVHTLNNLAVLWIQFPS